MTIRLTRFAIASTAIGTAVVALAQTTGDDAPALAKVLKCRGVADAAARLACYDAEVGNLQAATSRHDVVVMDQNQVAATRRSLFGFPLPRIPLFAVRQDATPLDKSAPPTDLDRIESKLRSANQVAGRWLLVLDDGARWEQVESGRDADEPKAGMSIAIHRASLGTYFARIGSHISMRIRRVS